MCYGYEWFTNPYRFLLTLAAGQLLALLLSGTGVFSQLLEHNYAINTPTTQVFFMYFLLALTFTPYLAAFQEDFGKTLQAHGWKYGLLALLDVEGNYCFVLAYQYTSLTSIQVCVFCTVLLLNIQWCHETHMNREKCVAMYTNYLLNFKMALY